MAEPKTWMDRAEPLQAAVGQAEKMPLDPWVARSDGMRCATCVWFVEKRPMIDVGCLFGRCRRHSPTMSGYPAVFGSDWCGDHKLDENKLGRHHA